MEAWRWYTQKEPHDARGWHSLVFSLRRVGLTEEELAARSKIIALRPHDGRALVERSATYREMKRGADALRDIETAWPLLDEKQRLAQDVVMNTGCALADVGRFKEALQRFDQILPNRGIPSR